jgi:peroxiredoxin
MLSHLAPLLLLPIFTAAPAVESGTQLTYRGTMIAAKGDPVETRKSFDLTILVADAGAENAKLYWTIAEQGRGQWAWPDRFGQINVDAQLRWDLAAGPSLLYERPEGKSVVPLVSPLLAAENPLAKGLVWNEGRLEHSVTGSEKVAEHDAWRVEARSPYGHKRTLWVDKNGPVVVSLLETVFIGQGEQHELRMNLVKSEQLAGAELDESLSGFDSFIKLRDRLVREPRSARVEWNEQQIATLKSELPSIAKVTRGPMVAIAQAAEADTKDQRDRSGAVTALRGKLIGSPVPEFKLDAIEGSAVTHQGLKDNVTILHFWEYRDSPLEEPYGQVGYLDFLYRKREAAGVKVYGVAVDKRLADPDNRRSAISGVKKLRSFMNIGYPLLLDDGSVLKQFGDPRVTGAKLPLFVVVDASGKIVDYHVGFYEVERDRGLKELDEAVTKALGNRE